MPKLNVLIAGSTGYIGIQLIKLLIKHKNINIKYLCGNSSVGKNISFYDKKLKNKKLPKIIKFNKKFLKECRYYIYSITKWRSSNYFKKTFKKKYIN